ncbi:hypothetical protein DL98DRAFT_587372 [Cadophora sp. DSE1049]|nr:hypothetical protein DL98DRAFT_587372 [Cadophora sp. DSE1049]
MSLNAPIYTAALLQAHKEARRLDDKIGFGVMRPVFINTVDIDIPRNEVQFNSLSVDEIVKPIELAGHVARRENTVFKAEPPPKPSSDRSSKLSQLSSKKCRERRRKGGIGADGDDDGSDDERSEGKQGFGEDAVKQAALPVHHKDERQEDELPIEDQFEVPEDENAEGSVRLTPEDMESIWWGDDVDWWWFEYERAQWAEELERETMKNQKMDDLQDRKQSVSERQRISDQVGERGVGERLCRGAQCQFSVGWLLMVGCYMLYLHQYSIWKEFREVWVSV